MIKRGAVLSCDKGMWCAWSQRQARLTVYGVRHLVKFEPVPTGGNRSPQRVGTPAQLCGSQSWTITPIWPDMYELYFGV